jgi:hypothetical protein
MGTAIFFGMLVATVIGVFLLIPGNFAFDEGLEWKQGATEEIHAAAHIHERARS